MPRSYCLFLLYLRVNFSTNISKAVRHLSSAFGSYWLVLTLKVGNVLMISEGRSGVDDVFSLRDGMWLSDHVSLADF